MASVGDAITRAVSGLELRCDANEPMTRDPEVLVQRDCFGGDRVVELRFVRPVVAEGVLGDQRVRFTIWIARRDDALPLALAAARHLSQRAL